MTARVIDVREFLEYAGGHLEGAELVPLRELETVSESWDRTQPLQLVCRTGARAERARELLVHKGFTAVEVLKGGTAALQRAGRPLTAAEDGPWVMERQVRVAAGSLVLSFVALGALRSSRFYLGAGLVGLGLVFAGVSDTCMMGSVLSRMPWNRPEQARV